MQKKSRLVLTVALIAFMAGGGYYGWQKYQASHAAKTAAQNPAATQPAMVETRTLEESVFANTISAVGSLVAGEAAEIHAEIPGAIERIAFEEGQPVNKGDLLIQMDKSLIQTELQKAKAGDDVARATFGRDDKLKQKGFVSGQKWDLSKSELETAKAAVNTAAIRLEKTAIRAPFSGIVGLRNFSVGDYAETGQTLTTLVSIDPLKVEFNAPEKNYADIRAGQTISLTLDAFPDDSFTGTIYAIDPKVDVQTRNFTVKANIPNTDHKLRPGMYARIGVTLDREQKAILMPEESVIPQGSDTYVMKVMDGKATQTKVVTGLRQNGMVEIKEGLAAGDVVITAGLQRVKDGAAVKATSTDKTNEDVQPAAGE